MRLATRCTHPSGKRSRLIVLSPLVLSAVQLLLEKPDHRSVERAVKCGPIEPWRVLADLGHPLREYRAARGDEREMIRARRNVQLWEAEEDRIAPNRWSAENVKANLPSPPELHLVPSADHFAFIAPCNTALAERVPEICQDPPGFDRTAFYRDFNAAVVGFFQKQLEPVGARP